VPARRSQALAFRLGSRRVDNSKLVEEFQKLYKALRIAGYYRGFLEDVAMVRDAFRAARVFIDKIK
jgi:hypothetical protein